MLFLNSLYSCRQVARYLGFVKCSPKRANLQHNCYKCIPFFCLYSRNLLIPAYAAMSRRCTPILGDFSGLAQALKTCKAIGTPSFWGKKKKISGCVAKCQILQSLPRKLLDPVFGSRYPAIQPSHTNGQI